MRVIKGRNVHDILPIGMKMLIEDGFERNSRAGLVKVIDGPVTTLYEQPRERVIFHPIRDANPFFHFMEGLWMLAGRNDVKWISQFNSTFPQFSDNGIDFHGAYGYRWVNHFVKKIEEEDHSLYVPFNQLETVADILIKNHDDRRAVITMWSPEDDLGYNGKDVPCNTTIMFSIDVYGKLDMTVTNRSNDIIWGAYGANAVHMSMLQEVMAAWIGVPVGRYWQVSNNYHAYIDVLDKYESITNSPKSSPYSISIIPFPMVNVPIQKWFEELAVFIETGPVTGFTDIFFRKVACPLHNAWFAWKDTSNPNRAEEALTYLQDCKAKDWKIACEDWILRRRK